MKSVKSLFVLLVVFVFIMPILVMAKNNNEQLSVSQTNYWQSSGNHIYNLNAGNVGIGTSNPQAKLDVFGAARIQQYLDVGYQDTMVGISLGMGGHNELGSTIFSSPSSLDFFHNQNTFKFNSLNSATPVFVGIGLSGGAYPQSSLHIKAANDIEGLRIVSSNHSPFVVRNSSDNGDLFRINQAGQTTITGNVGIGTTAPSSKLEVNGAIKASSYLAGNGQAGLSASFALKSASGSDCVMNFSNGLLTSSTCETAASQKINYSR